MPCRYGLHLIGYSLYHVPGGRMFRLRSKHERRNAFGAIMSTVLFKQSIGKIVQSSIQTGTQTGKGKSSLLDRQTNFCVEVTDQNECLTMKVLNTALVIVGRFPIVTTIVSAVVLAPWTHPSPSTIMTPTTNNTLMPHRWPRDVTIRVDMLLMKTVTNGKRKRCVGLVTCFLRQLTKFLKEPTSYNYAKDVVSEPREIKRLSNKTSTYTSELTHPMYQQPRAVQTYLHLPYRIISERNSGSENHRTASTRLSKLKKIRHGMPSLMRQNLNGNPENLTLPSDKKEFTSRPNIYQPISYGFLHKSEIKRLQLCYPSLSRWHRRNPPTEKKDVSLRPILEMYSISRNYQTLGLQVCLEKRRFTSKRRPSNPTFARMSVKAYRGTLRSKRQPMTKEPINTYPKNADSVTERDVPLYFVQVKVPQAVSIVNNNARPKQQPTQQVVRLNTCHATRRKHDGWDTARLRKPRQKKSRCSGRIRTSDIPFSVYVARLTSFAYRDSPFHFCVRKFEIPRNTTYEYCHTTRKKHEGWDTARSPKPRQEKSRCSGRVRTLDLPPERQNQPTLSSHQRRMIRSYLSVVSLGSDVVQNGSRWPSKGSRVKVACTEIGGEQQESSVPRNEERLTSLGAIIVELFIGNCSSGCLRPKNFSCTPKKVFSRGQLERTAEQRDDIVHECDMTSVNFRKLDASDVSRCAYNDGKNRQSNLALRMKSRTANRRMLHLLSHCKACHIPCFIRLNLVLLEAENFRFDFDGKGHKHTGRIKLNDSPETLLADIILCFTGRQLPDYVELSHENNVLSRRII
ncbi:hypothetical protein CLF_110655 [Clonorchis sinensis]|uniref:Uncharacterized protein n=1 Tax=Clonorchis sinensis TaxID=79923 RepID=G7YL03_CLOSI|nr:hypothetical protein CLF_110655 [Clonorchis sinensis]